MSERISKERLDDIASICELQDCPDHANALRELQRFRELEKQLRALAERMRGSDATNSVENFGFMLDCLLSAHGSAQPEAKS